MLNWFFLIAHLLQIQVSVRSVALNRHDLQGPSKILRIKSGQRQSVTQSAHGRINLPLTRNAHSYSKVRSILVQELDLAGAVEVIPNAVDVSSLDAASLVADLHDDVAVAVSIRNHDLDRRELIIILMLLDRGSHRVLEQLEQNVPKHARNVRKTTVLVGVDGHGHRLTVLTIAHLLRLITTR